MILLIKRINHQTCIHQKCFWLHILPATTYTLISITTAICTDAVSAGTRKRLATEILLGANDEASSNCDNYDIRTLTPQDSHLLLFHLLLLRQRAAKFSRKAPENVNLFFLSRRLHDCVFS